MSIPSSPRRSRIAHFKTPFILSIAAPAVLGLGCGGKTDDVSDPDPIVARNPPPQTQTHTGDVLLPDIQPPSPACEGDPPSNNASFCAGPIWRCVDGEWTPSSGSCNPPPPQSTICPDAPAEVGTSCWSYLGGLTCSYDFCYGATAPMRRCSETTYQWEEIAAPPCNPPPPDDLYCEATLPVAGSDCTIPVTCSYPGACESPSTATCQAGQWLVVLSSGPACNPPPVVPVCPERELVLGEACVYEGQRCSNEACEPGTESHDGYMCTFGQWLGAVVSCPPPSNAPDAGAADGGN